MSKRVPSDQQYFMNKVANSLFDIYENAPRGKQRINFREALRNSTYFEQWTKAFPQNEYNTFESFEKKIASHITYVRSWRKCPEGIEHALHENAYGQRRNWNEVKAKYDRVG